MTSEAERIAMLCATFDCAESVASSLDRLGTWTTARRHDFLLHQGDRHDRCHVVLSGSADVKALGPEGQCVQIATVEPGEIFGVYPEPREVGADVQAKGAMVLVSLDAAELARLARAQAEAGAGLARIFARQLGTMLDRFAARVTLSATGRVHACLLARIDEHGAIRPEPVVAALAVEAQTTRETASRAVGALERRGILRRDGNGWHVTSPRLLEELVI